MGDMKMRPMKKRLAGNRKSCRARAGAIVEFAVVLPLLLTILFGIIEYGYAFMIRQTLQHAAREGGRLASLQTSVSPYTDVIVRVNTIMAPAGITTYQVAVTQPAPCEEMVTVSVPYADVSVTGGFFGMATNDLTGRCIMRKEGCTIPGG